MYKLNKEINNTTAYGIVDEKRYITVAGPLAKIAARWLEGQLKEIDSLFSTQAKSLKKTAIEYCEANFDAKIFMFDR